MSPLPLHPLVVHLPMALAVLLPLIALGVLVAWRKAWLPARAWLMVATLQLLLLGSAVVALNTGERDEDRAERVVSEAAIEAHEGAAKLFTVGSLVVFLLAAGTLLPRREGTRQALAAGVVAGSLGVLALGVSVGHKGGELVYRHGAGAAFADPGATATDLPRGGDGSEPAVRQSREHGDDDD